ncbi:MAG: hypothetical protein FWC78_00155 [Defluviitaleaceae bacterium]|nr:hypothetical protein [Defluviitaleaceae bacterium]
MEMYKERDELMDIFNSLLPAKQKELMELARSIGVAQSNFLVKKAEEANQAAAGGTQTSPQGEIILLGGVVVHMG